MYDALTDAEAAGNRAFARLQWQGAWQLVPISVRDDVLLDDLLGIDTQKTAAHSNVAAFLNNQPYNHMLLWGARGTGKSSLVRALFHAFAHLSIVQLACDDLDELAYLLWLLGKRDTQHYLLYIDDLSFAADDGSYRALKAVLDGSLQGIPDNVMLCVTSNRRHLLSEYHSDERAIHPQEDIEEHISLSERFGLRLAFHPLSQSGYLTAVAYWLKQSGIEYDEQIERSALQFALARGSRSARVAAQFVRHYQAGE
ncbi:ATP-binding protein [Suttonella sp. R2A3]|uniref:DUF815 domain-containing protein n=1 Tax=Suttonella sp. R2A3 TaxID=2908648 RepID=UPI001F30CAC9|nr:DUF815 domain-containing protein [Suttonella sp. R2A3]UJF24154.1 ATP-binding protein [Suttonella sp. R2A3]